MNYHRFYENDVRARPKLQNNATKANLKLVGSVTSVPQIVAELTTLDIPSIPS